MRTSIRKLIILLLLSVSSAHSAEWKIDPTLRLRTGYDDNIFLRIKDKVSSAEASFSPSAIFSVATPTSGVSGDVRFDFRRYEADSNLDDNNSRIEVSSFHNLERTRLGLDLNFIKDTTLDSQLDTTGLAVGRVRRQSISASPNWRYNFNERTSLNASYNYNDVEYKNSGGTGFVNFTVNSAQASLIHVVNERATASFTLSRSSSDNDNDVESTNTNIQASSTYRFSQTLSASLSVGARRTETDFSQTSQVPIFVGDTIIFVPLTQDISNSSSGFTFSSKIAKTFLRGQTALSASRNISNDINGRPIETTRLGSTSQYRFSDTLSTSLKLDAYNSTSENNIGQGLDRNYYTATPEFGWKFRKFWRLSGSYRYRLQTFDSSSGEAKQNAAYLTLTYQWPRIAASR